MSAREKDPARQVNREEPDTHVSLVFFLEENREVTEEEFTLLCVPCPRD